MNEKEFKTPLILPLNYCEHQKVSLPVMVFQCVKFIIDKIEDMRVNKKSGVLTFTLAFTEGGLRNSKFEFKEEIRPQYDFHIKDLFLKLDNEKGIKVE